MALITKSIYRTQNALGKGTEEEKEHRYSSINEEGHMQFYRTFKVHTGWELFFSRGCMNFGKKKPKTYNQPLKSKANVWNEVPSLWRNNSQKEIVCSRAWLGLAQA